MDHLDVFLYVMTPELELHPIRKIDMLDFADLALNKFDKRGVLDALRDVKNSTSAIITFGMQVQMICLFSGRFAVQ
jgi:methylmalonyl-CoA mutase